MKKNFYPEKVAAIKLLLEGAKINYVAKKTGIGHRNLKLYLSKYKKYGEMSLLDSPTYHRHLQSEKFRVIEDITNNGLSLLDASLKYEVYTQTIARWLKKYKNEGLNGLTDKRMNRTMVKKKLTKKEQDELKNLRERNEYLEAENALLKKVKALVEAREARLRETGRKPSRN